jgi:transposase-like protein
MIKHSEEFKREAVRIALTSGLPRARVAADLGVGKSTLGVAKPRFQRSEGSLECEAEGSGWRTIVLLTWCRHRKPTSLWRMNGCALRTAF